MTCPRRLVLVAFSTLAFASPALADGLMTGGVPLVATNTTVGTNLAAGIGNGASQQLSATQSSQPLLRLDFSGRSPLVSTNVDVGTNVAAGLGNFAVQGLGAQGLGARQR